MGTPRGRETGTFDVAIVGAGVIGCALARKYALAGARIVVIEKAADILDGASKANSAILHTGFDAPPGSLEAACVSAGYREYLGIRERLGLPLLKTGALVIAWTEEQEAILPSLIEQAHENGVSDVEMLTHDATLEREPRLAGSLRASFRVPGEFVIDPWSAPHAYLGQAIEHGAVLMRSREVQGGDFGSGEWTLHLGEETLRAQLVINSAGLYGDDLDRRLIGESDFTIRPRKGQFVVYDKPAAALAGHILLPVPTKITKGVVVCRTAFGNLLVGPTAEEQDDKVRAGLDHDTLQALRMRGEEILPALRDHDVTAVYAGLRPATEFKDYCIRLREELNYVTVGGIRSTGLSSALGTAAHVFGLTEDAGHTYSAPKSIRWSGVANISAEGPRDCESPGNGGVVCQCELVTRREIEEALKGPLGARSLAGVKRRTRVTMGRCQGFHCTAKLAEITREVFETPMAEGIGNG